MSDILPNLNPPPKPTKIEAFGPPKASVPEVSLVCDSEDSIVIRPGQPLKASTRPITHHNTISTYNGANHPISRSNVTPNFTPPNRIFRNLQAKSFSDTKVIGSNASTQMMSNYRYPNPHFRAEEMNGYIDHYSNDTKDSRYNRFHDDKFETSLPARSLSAMGQRQNYNSMESYNRQNIKQQSGQASIQQKMYRDYSESCNYTNTVKQTIRTPTKVRFSSQTSIMGESSSEKRMTTTNCRSNMDHNKENITPDIDRHEIKKPIQTETPPVIKYIETEPTSQVDPHIYKLIEGQNQQILHLQKVLEKLLDRQNEEFRRPSYSEKSPEKANDTLYSSTRDNKKIAIVQTSFVEDKKPVMKSVGCNTDVTWNDLIKSVEQKFRNEIEGQEFYECRRENLKQRNKNNMPDNFRHVQENPDLNLNQERSNSEYQKSEIIEHREMSVMMRDLVITTVQDNPPSPEPSIHIQMPDFPEEPDSFFVEEPIRKPNSKNHGVHFTRPQEESPVLGESASMNRQRTPRSNQAPCTPVSANGRTPCSCDCQSKGSQQAFDDEENDPDDNPGVTFLNNVLKNLNRALGSNEDQKQVIERPQNMEHTTAHPKLAKKVSQTDKIRQQLNDMGISFVDPSSLSQHHRPIDTLYMPDMDRMMSIYQNSSGQLEAALSPQNYMMNEPMNDYRPNVQNYRSNPRLNHQNIPGRNHRPRDRNEQLQDEDTNFSTTTKNFLEKYNC